jgi:hypothetical protein
MSNSIATNHLYDTVLLDKDKDEIRILILLPAQDFEQDIHCRLIVAGNAEDLEYKALSYVWGDQHDAVPVRVNGADCNITQNLAAALRHLRDRENETPLWVDAICINQADSKEKSWAVSAMYQAHSRAQQTIAWLGIQSNDSDLAIDLIQKVSAYRGPYPHLFDEIYYRRNRLHPGDVTHQIRSAF